jgi:hypothetical protein
MALPRGPLPTQLTLVEIGVSPLERDHLTGLESRFAAQKDDEVSARIDRLRTCDEAFVVVERVERRRPFPPMSVTW